MPPLRPGPVIRKRSVDSDRSIVPPVRILQMAEQAYKAEFISANDRLEQAAFVTTSYEGGFRINESRSLLKGQFKKMKSLEKREFMVIESVMVEKSGGRMRNCPIVLEDPLTKVLLAHLSQLEPNDPLFSFSERTGRNIADRASNGIAWPHWFRAQRDRFLSTAFVKTDRNVILGWSSNVTTGKERNRYRTAEDFYASLNWMSYADRLGKLTDSYWQNETIPQGTKDWLDSLTLTPTTTTKE